MKISHRIQLFLLFTTFFSSSVAFVSRHSTNQHYYDQRYVYPSSSSRGRTCPLVICGDMSGSRQSASLLLLQSRNSKGKNFVEEILDALDTMVGVSPFSEADLKDSAAAASNNNNVNNNDDLVQRVQRRSEMAPPSDALDKPSVAIFFAILGLLPCIFFVAAVKSGIRPFGL
mmetsp:Transcript_13988/g.18235  ORF Transcript_13988/g.18235 Transcript_13988/m.18235 type:complete len:172 (-) Transcript_13988:414-929(-)